MKKLVMLFIVLAVCVPAYSEILIYKVATAAKVYEEDSHEFVNGGIKSYIVIEVNDFNSLEVINDVEIRYFKNAVGNKVQDTVNINLDLSREVLAGKEFDAVIASYVEPGDITGTLLGKTTMAFVATGVKKSIPTKLEGQLLVDGTVQSLTLVGTAKMVATLKPAWTKAANDFDRSFDETVLDIQGFLFDAGFAYIPK
jgi:hypothetical protein